MKRFAIPNSDNDNWPDRCSLSVKPKGIKCKGSVTSLECLDVSFNLCFEHADTLKFLSIQIPGNWTPFTSSYLKLDCKTTMVRPIVAIKFYLVFSEVKSLLNKLQEYLWLLKWPKSLNLAKFIHI